MLNNYKMLAPINNLFGVFPLKRPKIKQFFFYHYISSRGSGVHTRTVLKSFFKVEQYKKLLGSRIRAVGRTHGGTITVYTKGHRDALLKINYAVNYKNTKMFTMVLNYVRDYYTNKIAALCVISTGELLYLPQTSSMRLLQLMFGALTIKNNLFKFAIGRFAQYRYCECIFALTPKTKICYFSDNSENKIKFCKACGEFAYLIKIFRKMKKAKAAVMLPSKQIKLINSDNVVLLGNIVGKKKKFFKYTRAGYWRRLGFKQTVRGVVKNPVDHPHGGRTRTVLWPRTPWGKSTK